MGLFGILTGLGGLIWFAFRGWSILLLAPAAALVAAAFVLNEIKGFGGTVLKIPLDETKEKVLRDALESAAAQELASS
jgi:hypothetical protein